ncbi:methyl-accepting chemotaxis protein [Aliarcobacter skirrowii]|uniref:Methyl-accepting chemotaxis protein n=3 Tax=Aliarcobacter skirrowii TaxID=28200 RepID=A0AAD0SLD1_9BACT|nr:methyl-accepting chemotaxis protein [Aliarcobacter skirrowii]AXX84288.1 NIT sensor-containing MCP-domain signal transduction protein [Aliarcobacter skirrowii CCUG 10374]KAB0621530.1 chemotaxis protein [Aliarcobacter skirrowii CCUG 10374]RXI26786.1 methyl-accepting chemotaxis protein [Aliarcobacter skirrowii CCUG 10374]SUV14447.1 Aspartate chemoreceptor protein [Aliarcobacter skirrowii]
MKNLKLRNKIFLILVLPMIAILTLTSFLIVEKIENVSNMKKTSKYINFTVEILKVLKNLQIEREVAISYLNSYGANKEVLDKQINLSLNSEKELEDFINNFNLAKNDSHLLEKIEILKNSLTLLKEKRENIFKQSIDSKAIETFYNEIILDLISFFDELIVYSNSKDLLNASQTYILSVKIIEKIYQEKSLVSNIFKYKKILNDDYNRFISLLTFQDENIKELEKNLTQNQLDFYNLQTKNKAFLNIENLREVIFLKAKKDELINIMIQGFGFGGLIYHYNNLILTNDENILNKIQSDHTKILRAIREYRKFALQDDEKKFLADIQNSIDLYMERAFMSDYISDTKSIDKKTLDAFDFLSKNIYGSDLKVWIDSSNEKILVFMGLQNRVLEDTLKYIENKTIKLDKQIILFIIFLIAFILTIFIVILLMTSNITKAIKKFENNLNQFFFYSMKEKDEIKLNQISGKDEFALMTKNMNEQILKIDKITKNDKEVILKITEVMQRVNLGYFNVSIEAKSSTKELQTLVEIINKMLESTRVKLDSINLLLNQYSRGNYEFKLEDYQTKTMQGDFGILYKSTTFLAKTISSLISMIENAGENLEKNTKILANSSNELAISSSNQAISLKQTSSSLDQITQNIKHNNENISKMNQISDELSSAAQIGNKAAKQTFVSMDEISKKVKAINEAIVIIDQIAFQTNILSLNAAVEAATAGEAGKGFAVVAGEVRNLASKSSEAANSIKNLVESANIEATDGKNIADDMIKGYEKLSSKISSTKEIIENVTIFSKDQELAISKINQTLANLDETTQKNAQTASNIDSLSNEVSNLSDKLLEITSSSKIKNKDY